MQAKRYWPCNFVIMSVANTSFNSIRPLTLGISSDERCGKATSRTVHNSVNATSKYKPLTPEVDCAWKNRFERKSTEVPLQEGRNAEMGNLSALDNNLRVSAEEMEMFNRTSAEGEDGSGDFLVTPDVSAAANRCVRIALADRRHIINYNACRTFSKMPIQRPTTSVRILGQSATTSITASITSV